MRQHEVQRFSLRPIPAASRGRMWQHRAAGCCCPSLIGFAPRVRTTQISGESPEFSATSWECELGLEDAIDIPRLHWCGVAYNREELTRIADGRRIVIYMAIDLDNKMVYYQLGFIGIGDSARRTIRRPTRPIRPSIGTTRMAT